MKKKLLLGFATLLYGRQVSVVTEAMIVNPSVNISKTTTTDYIVLVAEGFDNSILYPLYGVKILSAKQSSSNPQLYLIKLRTDIDHDKIITEIKALRGVISVEPDENHIQTH